MKTRHLFLTLLACLVSINVSADIGTWTDENGTTWTFEYESSEKTTSLYGDNITPCISGTIPAELIIPASVYVNDVAYTITSIDHRAFSGCSNLTSVTIPEGVTSIGWGAFYGCSSLTSINIPEGVTEIGNGAFYGCSSLTSVTIPKGVTSIDGAFDGCTNLTSVSIPESVTSIGTVAFRDCSSLTSINIPEGVTEIGGETFWGCSSLTSINIPDGVTTIGERAFYECSSLTSINIPEGVTTINYMTFYGCSSLTSINIPDKVTTIEERAFESCSSLTNITIPEGVTSIGYGAFQYCSSLTSINIPESVTTIGGYAFVGCSSLSEVHIADITAWLNISFAKMAEPFTCPHHLYINNEEITELVIPNGVTNIGYHAFDDCSSLTSITIPEGVTNIGEEAFYGCSSLKSITIPESVTSIGNQAFRGCSSLTSITIPERVKTINEYTFLDCTNLTSVTISEGVTTIGWSAFAGCSNLTSINIPKSVTAINGYAFQNCSSLSEVHIADLATWFNISFGGNYSNPLKLAHHLYMNGKEITGLNIPEGITTIPEYAFENCSSLTSVTIPYGVTSIGNGVFSGCSSLTDINIPEGVKSIGDSTFEGCSSLTNINIPYGVTTIGNNAFRECSSLTNINFPYGVTIIGDGTFYGCSSLTNFAIPEGVTTIGEGAFSGCSSLTSFAVPEGVTTIGGRAFQNCSSLTSITIPKGVTSIGGYAFTHCSSLTAIKLEMRTPIAIGGTVYDLCDNYNNVTLYVPRGSKAAYEAADVWKEFGAIVEYDYVEVKQSSIAVGSSTTIEIGLNNFDSDLVAFQMELTLPQGVSIDKTGCSLSSRITDEEQGLTIVNLEDGTYRLTSSSLSLKPISGKSGTLLTLKLTATEKCDDGQATISNIGFFNADSKRINMLYETFNIDILHKFKLTYMLDGEVYKTDDVLETTPLVLEAEPTKEGYTFSGWSEIPPTMPEQDVTVTGTFSVNSYSLTYTVDDKVYKSATVAYGTELTPEAEPTKDGYTFSGWSELPETMPGYDVEITGRFYLYGDVNADEEVDVVDVVDIARFVVATPSTKFREKLADLNSDNSVNLGDAVVLVNHIAGDVNFAKAMYAHHNIAEASEALSLTKNGKTLDLNLTGGRAYTAFQFDLYVDEDATVNQMTMNALRNQGHQLLYNKVEDGHYRVAVLSTSNATFNGNEGELLSFVMDDEPNADTEISNIQFFDTKGKAYAFDAIGIGLETDIKSVPYVASDAQDVEDGKYIENGRVVIYRSGRKYSANGVLLK